MKPKRKPLSTKKPPIPGTDHSMIEDWINNNVMPGMQALVRQADELIRERIPDLHYSIKRGYAFYGTRDLGWVIELAPFAVSANIVFLSGADFAPQPPLGDDDRTRYIY